MVFVAPLWLTLCSRYQDGGDVGFTPAWARSTITRGTRTLARYRLHYAVHLLGPWLGTLSTLVVFSCEWKQAKHYTKLVKKVVYTQS